MSEEARETAERILGRETRRMLLFMLASVMAAAGSSDARDNSLESWYTYWGLGYVNNAYPGELQELLDEIDDLPGGDVDHLPLALDMFGFYWPRGDRTLVGGIVNSSVDTYEVTLGEDIEIDIYNYLYGISAMHFLAKEIGQGPFLRVDMGLARHVAEAEVLGEEDERATDWGTGILLGGGYGIPVTSGTRLLFNANFALRRVEGEQTSSLVLSLNGLF